MKTISPEDASALTWLMRYPGAPLRDCREVVSFLKGEALKIGEKLLKERRARIAELSRQVREYQKSPEGIEYNELVRAFRKLTCSERYLVFSVLDRSILVPGPDAGLKVILRALKELEKA